MITEAAFGSHVLEAVIATLYAAVGYAYAKRAAAANAHAMAFFSLFWFGMSAYGLAQAAWGLSYLLGFENLTFAVAILHMKVLFGAVAFLGLVYYVLFTHLGSRALLAPTIAFYVLVHGALTLFYVWREPVDQEVTTWGVQLVYANAHDGLWLAVVLLLFVPPLIASIGYALLLRVVDDREMRFRVLAVSATLFAFFGGTLLAWLADYLTWWGFVDRGLALVTVLAVILALNPPRWLRARLSEEEHAPA